MLFMTKKQVHYKQAKAPQRILVFHVKGAVMIRKRAGVGQAQRTQTESAWCTKPDSDETNVQSSEGKITNLCTWSWRSKRHHLVPRVVTVS